MTDTESVSRESMTDNEDPQACFIKSLVALLKTNRNVLSSLPEMIERLLDKETEIPNKSERTEHGEDDLERLARRKQADMEKKVASLQEDVEVKTQRIQDFEQSIIEKNGTIEAMKREQNSLMPTKDRRSVEKELKLKEKLIEESDEKVKRLEEENLKLKKELKKKEKDEKEITEKAQEEKRSAERAGRENDKEVKRLKEEILKLKSELERKEKEITEKEKEQEGKLSKKREQIQKMYDEYSKVLANHKSRNDSLISEVEARDGIIEEFNQRILKMKDDLQNAYTKVDFYKSRLASLSEKRVKQDQRFVEDTTASNRQSELEKDFAAFFDEERLDACEKMQATYQNKEDEYVYIYYPRLACFIFETAYEQVKEAKEAAFDLFNELIKTMIEEAPAMGQWFSLKRKEQHLTGTVPITLKVKLQGDGSYYNKDILDGMILSLKETTNTSCAGFFLNSVAKTSFEKWKTWSKEDESCMFTPAEHLLQQLEEYIKSCIHLTWRMVTQVPPLKLEFHLTKFNKDIHKDMGYQYSRKTRHTNSNSSPPSVQGPEIKCYLWPGLLDGGGRLIRAGEVICKVMEKDG